MSTIESITKPQNGLHLRSVLVKCDVVMSVLGLRPDEVYDRVDGGDLLHPGFVWVWDLAVSRKRKRDLRFFAREVIAPETTAGLELSAVLDIVLPPKRTVYHSGDLLRMFQIRRPTLADLRDELKGRMLGTRNCVFPAVAVRDFLSRRWQGAQQANSAN